MSVLSFDKENFLMDGAPYRIISGAMHYFRVLPEYWEDRMKKLKACGFNTLETYTCWNLHERREGEFDFSGRLDIVRYIETARDVGLNVILRPGPYICAEWEFGGLPSWLLNYPQIGLRCNDPVYLEKVKPYYSELLSRVRPYLCTNGGNIIMMQVENEYGSYGNDKEYLLKVEEIYRENGIDCLLFTSDGATKWMLNGGTLPHLLSVANFGSKPEENFRSLREFRQDEPLMCGEFWCGWFDHWYEEHHTRSPEDVAKDLEDMLRCGASLNFYMFHGGTNFGFTNGANHTGEQYQPTVTSYDYSAPLSECGDRTPTYYAVRKMIEKYTGVIAPELDVKELPKQSYGEVRFSAFSGGTAALKRISNPIFSPTPKSMEEVGQDFGYILYSTTLRGPFEPRELVFEHVHDRAIVFLNGERVGLRERSRTMDKITLSLDAGETARLDILVENMGRVNYGTKLFDRKGILGGIRLGQQFHFGWEIYCLPMEDLSAILWEKEVPEQYGQPAFLRGTFRIDGVPADTFLKTDSFCKGFCMINGFNVGRYFNIAGPQKTLYIPAPLLKEGDNEIILFESDGYKAPVVEFVDAPDLG